MKPVSVRFACFGPYVEEQFIDFERLEKNGIFLISGETGAGKTTILDAVSYALYGRSSGGLRGDMSVMRCKLAQDSQPTYTEFVFDSAGRRYKFVRTLKFGRKKLNDSHNCLVLEDGEYVPIFENPKATFVNQKAEELIGLTYEQFRQVIVLPQGQFERLLVSDSAEKEKILVSLFHANRWQKITDELSRRALERDNSLKQEKAAIQAKLAEYSCDTTDALAEKAEEQKVLVADLAEQHRLAQKDLEDARSKSEQAALENRDFVELDSRRKRLADLKDRTARMDQEAELLALAEKAEKIRPDYQAFCQAGTELTKAEQKKQDAAAALQKAEQEKAEAEQKKQAYEESQESIKKMQSELVRLEDAREIYACLPEKENKLRAAQLLLNKAEKEKLQADQNFSRWDNEWLRAQLDQRKAIEDYQLAQSVYLKNIGSVLAAQLVQGQPCPVCGSLEHPAPAPEAEEQVTQEEVEEKNRLVTRMGNRVTETADARKKAEEKRNQAADDCQKAEADRAVLAADLEAARARRFRQIENLTQLEKQIQLRKSKVQEYEAAGVQIARALEAAGAAEISARAQLTEKTAALQEAETAWKQADTQWQKALEESGLGSRQAFLQADMEPEKKQERQTALFRFRAELQSAEENVRSLEASLEGRMAPDMVQIRKELSSCETREEELSRRSILGENRLKTMESDLKLLEKRNRAYETARLETDEDIEFANRLRGRSGVSLQRYVLGVMLTAIAVEANQLLSGVYGGRYRLYRTDAISGSGHKGGLELEVYDSQNNQRRSVTTLSGGEKFLVALSLAIGLSTVVQAQGQGIRLEAMFIDEGFGSLDKEAVMDALEVLRGIQRSSGTVGIISHVETLAEIIPTQLEITKGSHGSRCRVLNA